MQRERHICHISRANAPLFIHLPFLEIILQVRKLWRGGVVDFRPHLLHSPLVVICQKVLPVKVCWSLGQADTASISAVHGGAGGGGKEGGGGVEVE